MQSVRVSFRRRENSFAKHLSGPGEAEMLAIQLMAEGQRIPERCALALQGEPPPDNGRAERMLELLPRIA